MFKKTGCKTGMVKVSLLISIFLSVVFIGKAQKIIDKNIHSFTITPQQIGTESISPLLYSNFIELGYGLQVEAMWSELFFNRSFEPFKPYKTINKLWYDLYYDEKDLSKGYEKDWSKFDWYHSGYQHNAWFAAPGEANNPSFIEDSSTFFITTSPLRKVVLTPEKGGSGHGRQCLKVTNNETTEWGAIAQAGKLFRKGETYNFRGMIKAAKTLNAEVRFYPQGKWDKPLATFALKNIDTAYSEQTFTYDNNSYDGYVTFSLWIPAQSTVWLDDFSLMPSSNYYGWRNDVVETFKQLQPKVVRFPGGCFASFYDWKDGIGPYSKRVPSDSYFWGGQNYNDVGTAEFAMLCKAAGAEMSMCVNVYHPSKRLYEIDFPDGHAPHGYDFPKFMSLNEGAQRAAQWVAYCNLPAGKDSMANLRASHGYKEPFGVKFWELDNEVARWFEAADYAWATVVYSKAMKAVDPTIQIGMSAYGDRPGKIPYHQNIDSMLEIAGHYIDFLADRGDADSVSRHMLEKVRTYNKKHGTHIKYCDTEWLAYNTEDKRDAYNMSSRKEGEVTKSYAFSKWLYGMNLLKNFMSFQQLGDDMMFVNFNNLANTHSQSAMETPKEGAYLTASGKALQLLSNSPAAQVLKIDHYQPLPKDEFQVEASWNMDKTKLVLYVCNRTDSARQTAFNLSLLSKQFSNATVHILKADSPVAMNTLQHSDAIQATLSNEKAVIKNGVYNVSSPAYSFTEIILNN